MTSRMENCQQRKRTCEVALQPTQSHCFSCFPAVPAQPPKHRPARVVGGGSQEVDMVHFDGVSVSRSQVSESRHTLHASHPSRTSNATTWPQFTSTFLCDTIRPSFRSKERERWRDSAVPSSDTTLVAMCSVRHSEPGEHSLRRRRDAHVCGGGRSKRPDVAQGEFIKEKRRSTLARKRDMLPGGGFHHSSEKRGMTTLRQKKGARRTQRCAYRTCIDIMRDHPSFVCGVCLVPLVCLTYFQCVFLPGFSWPFATRFLTELCFLGFLSLECHCVK